MNIRKSLAGIAASAIAITGVAVATAPAANAYSGTETIRCRLYFADAGVGSSPSQWTETVTVTQSPANPNAGDTVTATVTSTGGGNAGPVPVNANTLRLAVNLVGTGPAPASVSLQSSAVGVGSYPAANVAASGALGGWSASGTYTAAGNGAASLALGQIKFDAIAPIGDPNNVDTYCSDSAADIDHKASPATSASAVQSFTITGPNTSVTSITGQAAGVTGFARAGDVLNVGGTVWAASDTITAVTVGGVDASAGNTLAVSAGGVISGGVTVPAGTGNGNQSIVITGATTGPVTSSIVILANPTFSVGTGAGASGTPQTLAGSQWNPSASVSIQQKSGATNVGSATSASVDAAGNLSGSVTIQPGIDSIVATQGSLTPVVAAFAVNADQCAAETFSNFDAVTGAPIFTPSACATKQDVTAVVNPGSLRQDLLAKVCIPSATPLGGTYAVGPATATITASCGGTNTNSTSIVLGTTTTSAAATRLGGVMNSSKVTDARGVIDNWSLTATLSAPFTGTGNATGSSIAKSNFVIGGVVCAPTLRDPDGPFGPASASNLDNAPVIVGAGGSLTGAQTLCSNDGSINVTNGSSGGQYTVDANVQLTVPAFQKAGGYATQLILTLV